MRKSFLILSILGLGMVAAPGWAQDMPPNDPMEAPPSAQPAGPGTEMTPEQRAAYDSWPMDQRAQFDTWPTDTQAYYWTLTPPRQEVFWRISENDKLALTAMDDADREAAWDIVEQRMLSNEAPVGSQAEETPPLPDDKAE